MTTKKRPESDKNAKKNKRLGLNKQTLKDLSAKGKGPVGAKPGACSYAGSGCV